MNNIMRERLQSMENRYQAINDEMMNSEVLSDPKKLAALGKEQASLRQAVEAYESYKQVENHYLQAKEMLELGDPDIKEMAELEMAEGEEKMQEMIAHLEIVLIPKDPVDDNNAMLEIRGAAGGDEGNIFAGDLYRMYSRYAETLGYKMEVMEASEAEAGGYTLISFMIKGNEAYRHFKFESGAHRVQRVPKTETQGRIHTSTATVLCLPEIEEADVEIDPNDLVIETHRASGAGGQHVNKTDSAVRITHTPTGISVNCQDGRSQHANRDTAMKQIRARVYEEYQRIKDEAQGEARRSKIGRGDRSEKIRTYNYPQNRVTDHRIGLTIQQLDRIVEGKMDDIVDALLEAEQKEKMQGEA